MVIRSFGADVAGIALVVCASVTPEHADGQMENWSIDTVRGALLSILMIALLGVSRCSSHTILIWPARNLKSIASKATGQ